MTMTANATLVLSKGELYFNQFAEGTFVGEGEMYLGNTPGFSVASSFEELKRYTSYGGQQIELEGIKTREVQTADITTDNMVLENLALWFGGTVDDTGQEAVGTITETFTVKRGRWYQLGTSFDQFGVRHVEPDIAFTKGGSPLAVDGNLTLDRVEGRFLVNTDAVNLADGDTISVSFQWRQSFSRDVRPSANEITGSLRYISKNPFGPDVSYFFPYVRIKANGEIDLKGEQWQEVSLDVEIRKLNPLTPFFFTKMTSGPLLTDDEQAIIELGPMSLDEFPYWEDQLDQIINVFMPAANYGQVITYP